MWRRSKKWDVVSSSNLHSHKGVRKSRKLCLNLCSFKWLKPNRSFVKIRIMDSKCINMFWSNETWQSIFKGSIWRHVFNIDVKFVPFGYDIGIERILTNTCDGSFERVAECKNFSSYFTKKWFLHRRAPSNFKNSWNSHSKRFGGVSSA